MKDDRPAGRYVPARPRWKAPRNRYTVLDDGRVKAEEGTEVYRITGTAVGALMGLSPFETPYTAQCRMLGLNERDLSDNEAVRTGIALEPRVIDYLAQKHSAVGTFLPAETVFAPRRGRHEDWPSDWDDPDFGGHVDGIISKDGQEYILEIKTVRNIDGWGGQIPPHYLWQVYLYNHFLTRQDKAYFGIGVVDERDYKDPDNWTPNCRNCLLVEIKIDRNMVAAEIEKLRSWRHSFMETLTTDAPDTSNLIDSNLCDHLRDYMAGENDIKMLVNRLEYLRERLEQVKAGYRQMEVELETAKARLKDIMLYHDITSVGNIKLSISKQTTYDIVRATKDGIDMTPYLTVTEIPRITISKPKNPKNKTDRSA